MEKDTIGILGGLGIIFLLVGGAIGGVGILAGLVLLLIAYFHMGKLYDKNIFNKILVSFIIAWIGVIVSLIVSLALIFSENPLLGVILGVSIFYLSFIVSGYLYYKGNELISKKTNFKNFKTGGFLIFIGSITSIFLIGFIVYIIGEIFLCVGFFEYSKENKK